ncbi:MAG: hypothetical protein C4293_12030 [Nitrospiraceae bacterium]
MQKPSSPRACLLHELIDLLRQVQDCAQGFMDLLIREQNRLRTLSLQELVSIHEAKFRLLEDIRSLDEKRSAVINQLAGEWAVPSETLTLGEIARRIGGHEGNLLRQLQQQLTSAVAAVREANSFTGMLVACSLDFLHRGLRVCWGRGTTIPLYAPSGALQFVRTDAGLIERKG